MTDDQTRTPTFPQGALEWQGREMRPSRRWRIGESNSSLRSVIAEAIQAYELAQATRLQAEVAAEQLLRDRLAEAESDKAAELRKLESHHAQALFVERAEQERANGLLAGVDALEQAARTLLEAAGLAYIAGAPVRIDDDAAPVRRPDEVVAAAFAAAQIAHADLRTILLRLAHDHLAAHRWEDARRVVQPLLGDVKSPLYSEARLLLCETYYQQAVRAMALGDWLTGRQELQAVLRIDATYKDALSQLRASYLQAATHAGVAGHWQEVQEQLTAWLKDHKDDAEARDLLCSAYYHLIQPAIENWRLDQATQYLVAVQALDPNRQETVRLLARYPTLAWVAGATRLAQELRTIAEEGISVALSADRQVLVAGGKDKRVKVWDPATGKQRFNLWEHFGPVTTVTVSPNGQWLASGSEDRTLAVWALANGSLHRKLKGHKAGVLDVTISSDGHLLASASEDRTIRLWDLESGKTRQVLEEHGSAVACVAFSTDGQLLASGSSDTSVRIWNVESGISRQTLEGHGRSVSQVIISPEGTWLASGSLDGMLKIWDLPSGLLRHTLEGHAGGISCLAVSPDGHLLASGSTDMTVRIWESVSGRLRHTLNGYDSTVAYLAFSSDGQLLVSASRDLVVKVWTPR